MSGTVILREFKGKDCNFKWYEQEEIIQQDRTTKGKAICLGNRMRVKECK